MSFDSIKGQPLAVKLVQRWLAKETTQPLLFYGPDGAGKRALALEAAKALNCNKSTEYSVLSTETKSQSSVLSTQNSVLPCDVCLSCKKITAGRHPDVRVIDLAFQAAERGEPLEKQQSIKIETVLQERKRLYQTATEGRWKVSLLDEAERMTPDAANVLLKVLEEPPPRTAIFLITPYRDRIFPTLLSRCQQIRFKPVNAEGGARGSGEGVLNKKDNLLPHSASRTPHLDRATRADIEEELQRMLHPVEQELRSGHWDAVAKAELIQKAQQQLRNNVPPALVYDHLLLQLSKAR